jgi:hypothetical protein
MGDSFAVRPKAKMYNVTHSFRCLESPVLLRQIDPNVKNKESNTLLHLCVQQEGNRNMDAMVKTLLQRLDVKTSVNVVNGEGETALLKASRLERWPTVKTLLESDRVNNEVDVHVANSAGNTCLVVIMLARYNRTYVMSISSNRDYFIQIQGSSLPARSKRSR